jgi:hypothetical protein
MDIEQFEEIVDEFGEFPANWPDAMRAEAVRLLDASPRAQQIVSEAAEMRSMFLRSEPVTAPAGLADRIMALAIADDARSLAGQASQISAPQSSSLPKDLLGPKKRLARGTKRRPAASGFRVPPILKDGGPSYIVLYCCFPLGLGIGLALGFELSPLIVSHEIDFATLFAVVGS